VKYAFGALTMVVRFSVDACVAPTDASTQAPRQSSTPDVNSLSSNMSAMSMKSGGKRGFDVDRDASTAELDVARVAMPVVPQGALIEITTRSEKYAAQYDWEGTYPQLYFSQTQWRYLAVHNQGNFTDVRKRAGSAIQDLVVEHGERGRLSLVFEDSTLRVFGRKTQESCLPDTMLRRFEGL